MTSSNILRLREYEPAEIRQVWDPVRKHVPAHIVAGLEQMHSTQRKNYLAISRRRIKAQNYVGVVSAGGRSIEILPKTDESDDAARRRLVEMMSVGGLMPHLESGVAGLTASVPSLLDAFMQSYTRQLALEWRRGRISSYQQTEENRGFLRGKLLFHEQIRHNRLRPERFFTRADQFITDVPPSRLLKAGLDVCRRYGLADETRRSATTLLAEFDEVNTHTFRPAELDAVKVDRRIERFAPLLTMAKMFVRGCSPDRPGSDATFSLLFDMNVVFERYIGSLLLRACPAPHRVQLQVSGRSLVLRNGEQKFLLRPDAALRNGKQFSLIIDTKWKLLDLAKSHDGVKQSDMYQAYAYAREFDCPAVILLYPRSQTLSQKIAEYQLRPGDGQGSRIFVMTTDISQPPAQVRSELEAMIMALLARSDSPSTTL